MILNFETTDKIGVVVPYPATVVLSDKIVDELPYHIDSNDYPHLFDENMNPKLWEGWENFPLFTFDSKLYHEGKDPFIPYDPYSNEKIVLAYRREKINKEIAKKLRPQTELKKIRQAIEAIIEMLPELKNDARIAEFFDYNTTIKNSINSYDKVKIVEYIDLKKINGIEP